MSGFSQCLNEKLYQLCVSIIFTMHIQVSNSALLEDSQIVVSKWKQVDNFSYVSFLSLASVLTHVQKSKYKLYLGLNHSLGQDAIYSPMLSG